MTPRPDPNDELLPWLLRRVNQQFGAAVSRAMNDAGFSGVTQRGSWALQALRISASSASDLVTALHISKQAVSVLVDELVVGGYVERRTDLDDRRRTTLTLTPRGISAVETIEATCRAVEDGFVASLGGDSVAQLRQILRNLAAVPTRPEL